ncbi:MAG: sigma-70 family RNA polymerase sigma factor [Micrococcales bacterium]|nr:sigma-70 family RNA polymerase sigma factor [Micrococcales bacterium]
MSGTPPGSTDRYGASARTADPGQGPDLHDVALDWVAALSTPGPQQAHALAELHKLMLRAARHQVWRMRSQLGDVGDVTIDVLINQSADEAMAVLLRKLPTFEGRSRFTTWAYKFAILQTAAEVRRTAWRNSDVDLHDVDTIWDPAASPAQEAEATDLSRALVEAMMSTLTLHQRRVTIALAVDLVPVDVLAERLGTTRGALYKTLHDARSRLRAELIHTGYLPAPETRPGHDQEVIS